MSCARRGWRELALWVLGVASAWPVIAHAHVAPALDTNNRYLRVTPMRDRVRLAYTVYIGEVPGVQARRRMDENGDGQLDDDESAVYGRELAAQVARNLAITLDGAPYELEWAETHVGLGMPVTDAGSFSIDLIGWICGQDGATHTMHLFDRYRVPRPGETEVKIQPSPGIEVTRSSLSEDNDAVLLELKWLGEKGPLETRGLHLEYRVDQTVAEIPPGSRCTAPQRGEDSRSQERSEKRPANWLAITALGLLALTGLAIFVWIRVRANRVRERRAQNENG